ncbi:MAG: hypothetical protein LBC43_03065 [Bifidobacteriaceae bacterium]|jgi:S-formylglutathione hydrolase FrmB|nr:hypothetical protein [Bifidobacteriaceae bacterium]
MALFEVSFRSRILSAQEHLAVFTPELAELSKPVPTLFFLHGLEQDASSVLRKSYLEVWALQNSVAVVVADAGKSFYANMTYGERYRDFFVEELPVFLRNQFAWYSNQDRFNSIAGLSMGGYGALSLGLSLGQRFKHIFAFSAPSNLFFESGPEGLSKVLVQVFGNKSAYENSESDLNWLIANSDPKLAPDIDLFCGTEDFLFEQNVELDRWLTKYNFQHTFQTWTGGHDWFFWNECLSKMIF